MPAPTVPTPAARFEWILPNSISEGAFRAEVTAQLRSISVKIQAMDGAGMLQLSLGSIQLRNTIQQLTLLIDTLKVAGVVLETGDLPAGVEVRDR